MKAKYTYSPRISLSMFPYRGTPLVLFALLLATIVLRTSLAHSESTPHPVTSQNTRARQFIAERIAETQSEIARIFGASDEPIEPIAFKIVSPTELHSTQHVSLSAVYVDNTLFISNSLLHSKRNLGFTLRHEIMHWYINRYSKGRCPAWIDEGLAQYFSGPSTRLLQETTKSRRKALRTLSLARLESSFQSLDEDTTLLAYARSLQAARSLVFRWGFPSIRRYLKRLSEGQEHQAAFLATFGETPELFDRKSQK